MKNKRIPWSLIYFTFWFSWALAIGFVFHLFLFHSVGG